MAETKQFHCCGKGPPLSVWERPSLLYDVKLCFYWKIFFQSFRAIIVKLIRPYFPTLLWVPVVGNMFKIAENVGYEISETAYFFPSFVSWGLCLLTPPAAGVPPQTPPSIFDNPIFVIVSKCNFCTFVFIVLLNILAFNMYLLYSHAFIILVSN